MMYSGIESFHIYTKHDPSQCVCTRVCLYAQLYPQHTIDTGKWFISNRFPGRLWNHLNIPSSQSYPWLCVRLASSTRVLGVGAVDKAGKPLLSWGSEYL